MIQNHLKYGVKSWVDECLKKGDLINDGKDCLSDDQIHDYAAHKLSSDDRNNVMKHISLCMPCFIKTEQYYDNYTEQTDFKRQFRIIGSIDAIQYEHRADDLHLKVLSLTSDLTNDQYEEHPAIITVSKNENKSSFTNIPVTSDEQIHLSIAIKNKQVVFKLNSNIPIEIIYEKDIVEPLKITQKTGEVFETLFDFSKINDGAYYFYPEVIEHKVLSIYILKLQKSVSIIQTEKLEPQVETSNNEIDNIPKKEVFEIFEKFKSILALTIFVNFLIRHKRMMMCMLMLFLFSYFSYNYVRDYLQPSITKKYIVSLPWESEKSLAADASHRYSPRHMAFAAGLWKKRNQLFPDYYPKMPKCILPENARSEKDLDQWNQSKKSGIYYQLGIACLNIYAKKETDQVLTSSFIKEQIQIFKDLQNNFSKHADKNDIEFVDKRLMQIISILHKINDMPLKRQRNDLYMNIYSIIHYLSPHYALK